MSCHQHNFQFTSSQIKYLSFLHITYLTSIVHCSFLDKYTIVTMHPNLVEIADTPSMIRMCVSDNDIIRFISDTLYNLIQISATSTRINQCSFIITLQQIHSSKIPCFKHPCFIFQLSYSHLIILENNL